MSTYKTILVAIDLSNESDRVIARARQLQEEPIEIATERMADIGSHGRSGWKLLLGSTANKLLHGAHCDILTLRVGD